MPEQLQSYILSPTNNACVVCAHLYLSESNYTKSQLAQLNRAIVIAIDKLLPLRESFHFSYTVTPEQLPNYHTFVVNPMDLSAMRTRAIKNEYRSPEEFLYDLKQVCV